MNQNLKYKNFVEIIINHAENYPEEKIITSIPDRGNSTLVSIWKDFNQKAKSIAGYLQEHTKPGDRALLIFEEDLEFVHAFVGCLYAGVIAVPVFSPTHSKMLDRLKHIIKDASPAVCLADQAVSTLILQNQDINQAFQSLRPVNTQLMERPWSHHYKPVELNHSNLALLQYTSGSTGNPKGVMVTHGNLIHNEEIMKQWHKHTRKNIIVSFIPLYHDMGLIGHVLQSLYVGCPLVLLSNQRFLRNPLSWLKAISEHQGTTSGAPNFAFELCLRAASAKRIQQLDLSSWAMAFTGAEPVRYETLQKFAQTFAPCGFRAEALYPAYGLAEATLTITGGLKGHKPTVICVDKDALAKKKVVRVPEDNKKGLYLVGNGSCTPDQEVKIVNPKTLKSCAENEVGEVWVKGPSVTAGYWQKEKITEKTFKAYIADGNGPFLRTGDLGFLCANKLYFAGRLKDIIILNGRNYYPHDIEAAVEKSHPNIRFGRVAVFSINEHTEEELIVIAEFKGKPETARQVINAVRLTLSQNSGLKADDIVLVKNRTLPFTTSGKIRRQDTKDAYLQDRLEVVAQTKKTVSTVSNTSPPPSSLPVNIKSIILAAVGQKLNLDSEQIDCEAPLGQYGMSSIDVVELAEKLEGLAGIAISPTLIYENPTVNALVQKLESLTQNNIPTPYFSQQEDKNDPIAIIGMACNFPQAPDLQSFWQVLENGVNTISKISDTRKSLDFNSNGSKSNGLGYGAFIDNVKGFDAKFFNLSASEAEVMDPQHRKFIETVWTTIENAGYAPCRLAGTLTGVFAGMSSQDYSQLLATHDVKANAYTATGLSPAMLTNRLSYLLDLHGPSETIDTACSSALEAVHRAVSAIRNGECDQAIAGGVNLLLSPKAFSALDSANFLSPDGACKTFDASANGYVRGEGVGAVFLKPLSKAIEDKDYIYAVIKGSALRHGGRTASLTAPNENVQADLLKTAFKNAKISPQSISYIEVHGTGTVLGDPIEINGLKKAFNDQNESLPKANHQRCGLGSVKSNMGHAEAAAGIAALIKTVLALKHKTIPATIHFRRQNPYIDLEKTPFYIVSETRRWKAPRDRDGALLPLRAGVSSFGFGGAYAHVVLEEAPDTALSEVKAEQEPVLIALSAKTDEALNNNILSLYNYLFDPKVNGYSKNVRLKDLSYTLLTGRDHYAKRAAFLTDSKENLKQLLKSALEGKNPDEVCFFKGSADQAQFQTSRLKALTHAWLCGEKINWADHMGDAEARKIPLPGYQFEKIPYWLPLESDLQISKKETVKPPAVKLTLADVTQWLLKQAAEHLGLAPHQIDPLSTFEDLGLDSLALINIHSRIQKDLNLNVDISIIQEYPNIQALAHLIAEDKTFEMPDLAQEVLQEQNAFKPLLNQAMLKNLPAKGKGLGQTILLTGATGFLGAFLLKELIQNTQADICCLVRASSQTEGLERLFDIMARFQIADSPLNDRVHVLCGDLAEEKFGLQPETYEALAKSVDSVFHCGAIVDWMKPYMSLKKANVGGTVEAIKFCCHHKVKQLNYVSSLAVLPLIEDRPFWLESDQPDPEKLTNGYAQSKWVAETLCFCARNSGLPVNVYRFDYVAASPLTGVMKETDFIVRLIKGCIQLGVIPAEEVNFDILSIEYLSHILLQLARLNQSKTYHLINRQPFRTSDFTEVIRSHGYKIECIPFDVWKTLVKTVPGTDLYPLFPFLDQYSTKELEQYHLARIDNTNTLSALYEVNSELISKIPSAKAVMDKTISYFKKAGHLPDNLYQPLLERQLSYWNKQLADAPKRLELPFKTMCDSETISSTDSALETIKAEAFCLDQNLFSQLENYCINCHVDTSEVFLALFQILLCRYTRTRTIAVAVPVAESVKSTDFKIVKTPIIKTTMPLNASFGKVVQCVKQSVVEARANLDIPSDQIAKILYRPAGEESQLSYDTLFVYSDPKQNNRLNIHSLEADLKTHQFTGIKFCLIRSDKSIKGSLEYDGQFFAPHTTAGIIKHFMVLLQEFLRDPNQNIYQTPLLESGEQKEMLYHWNAFEKSYPSDQLVDQLISRQAQMRPDAVALRMDNDGMTYRELEEKSLQFAVYLKKLGVKNGDLIGVCMEKSFELIIGILGILKAGAAYFPLDPSYPEERKRYMMDVAEANLILALSATLDNVPETKANVICLDTDWEKIVRHGGGLDRALIKERHQTANKDAKIAYMIFTSGSTGKPKGVKVYHHGLVNLVYAYNEDIQIDHKDCVLTCASLSYDASVIEIFYPLLHGATLALAPLSVSRDGQQLKTYLDTHPITFMTASVATWRLLDYAGWQGSPIIKIVNGGEALPFDLAQTLIKWSKTAYNAYGPAEASVCTTIKKLQPNEPVTIGRPLANTKVYILDENLAPMPVGAAGEIYIGGKGVAKDYHNQPEMTAKKFLYDPFSKIPGAMLYRTGDLARYLPNGEIEFIGRVDNQIKLRGHRIELGEIEKALEINKNVKAATVLLRQAAEQEKKLVAYLIPIEDKNSIGLAEIKTALKKMLPSFMLPSDYVIMDAFPVTLGGKVDRKAFPLPEKSTLIEEYVAPKTAMEIQLADLWRQTLNLDRIGIHNNLLDLGLDSLSAMRLLIAINKRFNLNMTIQSLYENYTIARLAKSILNGGVGSNTAKKIDFRAETAFNLKFDQARLKNATEITGGLNDVLLTGVTGYLGVFILERLLKSTTAKIYCLVRADSLHNGIERIEKNFRYYGIWQESFRSRIKPIVGDLASPRLGISEDEFYYLSNNIDAVYHCGSIVNFAQPYSFLKKANVDGTKEIIRFAVNRKMKHLFYISTIGVFEQNAAYENKIIREDDDLPNPEDLFFGYSQSKWISEKIVMQAMEQGVPISIYRPGRILGHSLTGVSNQDDMINVFVKIMIMIGAMPDLNFSDNGLPVDFMADTIVRLSLLPDASGQRFNIVNPKTISVKHIINYIASFGYNLPILTYHKWHELLVEKAASNNFLLPYIPVISKGIATMNDGLSLNFATDNTKRLLPDYWQNAPEMTEKQFHAQLKHLVQIGLIPKPGTKTSTLAA